MDSPPSNPPQLRQMIIGAASPKAPTATVGDWRFANAKAPYPLNHAKNFADGKTRADMTGSNAAIFING